MDFSWNDYQTAHYFVEFIYTYVPTICGDGLSIFLYIRIWLTIISCCCVDYACVITSGCDIMRYLKLREDNSNWQGCSNYTCIEIYVMFWEAAYETNNFYEVLVFN